MDLYTFYFDESFHDRKILLNDEGKLNVLREDALENYVGVFWGCKNAELNVNTKFLQRFEQRQKARFGLSDQQELKSTVISKKNYLYGIHSFNKNTMSFYKELFEVMDVVNPILQINTISKVEYFLRKLFEYTILPDETDINAFFYSITKILIFYHNKELLQALYSANDKRTTQSFYELLIVNLNYILKAIDTIPRKVKEKEIIKKLISILSETKIVIKEKKKYNFAYFINFDGLNNLLEELHIDIGTVKLVIDQEEHTYLNALNYSFTEVLQADSAQNIQIRLCDWISGFIGQMMYGIFHDKTMREDSVKDIRKIRENDIERKHLLSKEWFDLSEDQFKLYRNIYEVLIVPHQYYWTNMTLSYGDAASYFYSLIRYVSSYEDYEKFKKISFEMHTEYYNACCCEDLERHYKNF